MNLEISCSVFGKLCLASNRWNKVDFDCTRVVDRANLLNALQFARKFVGKQTFMAPPIIEKEADYGQNCLL